VSQKKVETLNKKLMKGTPFKQKPLKTIEIGDVEVSEKMPTLVIEDRSKIMITSRKTIVEEVLDEEAPTLVANQQPISDMIIKEIPILSKDFEDSDEELLRAATLEMDEVKPKEDKMIIMYIKEEPVIGIFEKKDTLLTKEHDYPEYNHPKNSLGIH
jgi:hypothetical protein